jgi:hypothetical protein
MAQGVGTGELPLMKFLPSKGTNTFCFCLCFYAALFFFLIYALGEVNFTNAIICF